MPTDKQRRETERRRLQRQAQRRRQQAQRRKRSGIIGSIVGALVLVAVVVFVIVQTSGDSTPSASPPPTAPSTPAPTPSKSLAAYPCTWSKTAEPASRKVTVPPTATPTRTGITTVTVTTNRGPLTFALNRAAAPCAVESFVSLASQKFYDATTCHRLITGGLSALQCGDPTGSGSGGPGYSFADELTGKEQYTTGVLAMANSGKNTNGSQFFIVYKTSALDPNYTIFGTVTAGLPVIDKVAAGGDDGSSPAGGGKPKLPLNITSVRVAA